MDNNQQVRSCRTSKSGSCEKWIRLMWKRSNNRIRGQKKRGFVGDVNTKSPI